MTQEKKEPLSLKKMMEGFDGLYNPLGGTIFSLYLDANYITRGHFVWIERNLPAWAELLNKESGARVLSLSMKEKDPFERKIMSQIELKMFIDGKIKEGKIGDKEVEEMLSGQFKKMLAQRIERNFPPPFDYKKPLFASGVDDICVVYSSDHYRLTGEMEEKLFSHETMKKIKALAESKGAEFIRVEKCVKETIQGNYHHFVFQWINDVDDRTRSDLEGGLRNLLGSEGIDCLVGKPEDKL